MLGSYLNGYSIVQELYEKNVENIILFDYSKKMGAYSNKIVYFKLIEKGSEGLYNALNKLNLEYEKIIIFPTDDLHLEYLNKIYNKIENFCFIPLNPHNFSDIVHKYVQYEYCKKLGIPYPKTIQIKTKNDLDNINIQYPVLIKPDKREDLKIDIFKNIIIENQSDLIKKKEKISKFIDMNITFLASEIIPGNGNCVYAYIAYRNKNGIILNEWSGKKLSQFPNDFGIFASASNKSPEIVSKQGRKLIEAMNIHGIAQPEFKYDYRDGKFKLMEINLRSMMWHRVGNLSGVNVQYSQYMDGLGKEVSKQKQIKDKVIHFVYLNHEIINFIFRKKYAKIFYNNIFKSDITYFAAYDRNDIKPFIMDIKTIPMEIIRKWVKILLKK